MKRADLPEGRNFTHYDWNQIFGLADEDGWGASRPTYRTWPGGEAADLFELKDVRAIHAHWSQCSCRSLEICDSYCEQYYWVLAELNDGRWAGCEAWNDTTGWGCQDGIEWGIASDRETAWNLALSEEGRAVLLAMGGAA